MEMMNKIDDPCSFGGDVLAYLYDELSSNGRERFEKHLESCSPCISELAELSEARYSVYEWKNVEFAPLATPRFALPAESAPASASWLDSIRAAFSWNSAAAVAGGFAVLVVGMFAVALWQNSPDVPVAVNIQQPPVSNATVPIVAAPAVRNDEKASVDASEIETPEILPVAPRRQELSTVAARNRPEVAKVRTVRRAPAETAKTGTTTTTRRLGNSPTLGQYVEDRDEGLRLSDLFDDLDSRELD